MNAVVSAKDIADVEHKDVICFGHLLFEMCTGFELLTARPTADNLFLNLQRYPKVKHDQMKILKSILNFCD